MSSLHSIPFFSINFWDNTDEGRKLSDPLCSKALLWSYRLASGSPGGLLRVLLATYLSSSINNSISTCHISDWVKGFTVPHVKTFIYLFKTLGRSWNNDLSKDVYIEVLKIQAHIFQGRYVQETVLRN